MMYMQGVRERFHKNVYFIDKESKNLVSVVELLAV